MTQSAGNKGTSFADPIFDALLLELWKRWVTLSNSSGNDASDCSVIPTTQAKRGRKLRELHTILLQVLPPNGKIPDGMKDKEVLNLIEPEYTKQGKALPSVDTIGRARGRRKSYSSKARRPKN